jgi:hypothetical protein
MKSKNLSFLSHPGPIPESMLAPSFLYFKNIKNDYLKNIKNDLIKIFEAS